jgi:hypothetical protein
LTVYLTVYLSNHWLSRLFAICPSCHRNLVHLLQQVEGQRAVTVMVLLHVLEPEFDPSWRMLSEYSLGQYGPLMRVIFLRWARA